MIGNRTSLRQAIVIVSMAPADDLTLAALLDTISNLVGVDGVTLSLAVDSAAAGSLRTALPAGIDLLVAKDGDEGIGADLVGALEGHLGNGFQRVIAVAGDVLNLPARIAATGLGALESADVVVGPTPSDGLYLVGLRDERGIGVLRSAVGTAPLDLSALRASVRDGGLVLRTLEPRRRLGELDSGQAYLETVARAPELNPRLLRLLKDNS